MSSSTGGSTNDGKTNDGKTYTTDMKERFAHARSAIRDVERFAYRIVSDSVEPVQVEEARRILQLTVGLRRKLDQWKEL